MSTDSIPSKAVVAGLYAIDATHPRTDLGDIQAFVARRAEAAAEEVLAIAVPPGTPLRSRVLEALLASPVSGVLNPLAHGPATPQGGKPGYYVICQAPPGPSLVPLRRWPEAELLKDVLWPVATALTALDERHLTYRSLRPANLFQAHVGGPVMLGPAWAAPPASLQPVLYEPPYMAMCHPWGRGKGTIADDVYALGVVLLVLAIGREPLHSLDAGEIIQRKAALGSFAALTLEQKLSPAIGDYLSAMLADDPSQRPPPSALLPSRHVALRRPVRPERRAAQPLSLGGVAVSGARGLAAAMVASPAEAVRCLRLGMVERWLRRDLADRDRACSIEQIVPRRATEADAARADALLLMRATALIDPHAPLTWRGVTLFPDGLGPMLAASDVEATALTELIDAEVIGEWASLQPGTHDVAQLRFEARQNRMLLRCPGRSGGIARLRYTLNPLLPCQSPLVSGRSAVTLSGLLAALDTAADTSEIRAASPIDGEIGPFVLARGAETLASELSRLPSSASSAESSLCILKVFGSLQVLTHSGPLPGLGGWLAERATPILSLWREKSVRKALQDQLAKLAARGELNAMALLLENPEGRARDSAGLRKARAAVQRIDVELQQLMKAGKRRAEIARPLGEEFTTAVGLAAVAGALLFLAFG